MLGHYVREPQALSLQTAIHKMTRMPADRATFADPHQYAEGFHHVFVAGEAVLLSTEPTGAASPTLAFGGSQTGRLSHPKTT